MCWLLVNVYLPWFTLNYSRLVLPSSHVTIGTPAGKLQIAGQQKQQARLSTTSTINPQLLNTFTQLSKIQLPCADPMLRNMPKPLCNMHVPGPFDAGEENHANRKVLSLIDPVSNDSQNIQVENSAATVKQCPPESHPSPQSKKWFPLSPSSSCSTTPSLSEVEDDSLEMSQDIWERNFGINRAPWDAVSEDEKDGGENTDSFVFFVPSPVNECSSEVQHSMFHSSMFDDQNDELKEDCWIEEDEDTIPAPSEDVVTFVEQTLKTVVSETQQYQATNRNSSRHIQFTMQTGLDTIHEGKKYGFDDDSDCSISCCSVLDEALWEFLMPEDSIIDGGVDFVNPTPKLCDPNVLPTKSTTVNDRSTIGLTPEQRAAYDCLQALAFFL